MLAITMTNLIKSKMSNQPISNIEWIHRDKLKPNFYNPNRVAPPEMELLILSILRDGWTQPVVVGPSKRKNHILIDGYHRWQASGDARIYKLTDGFMPCVVIKKKLHEAIYSTIRHNRARGIHTILKMSEIVKMLLELKQSKEQIMEGLGMEDEEVDRLLNNAGLPESMKDKKFSKAWISSKD